MLIVCCAESPTHPPTHHHHHHHLLLQDLAGLEGGSPADSPRNSSAAQGSGTRRAGSASAEAGGPGSMGASRGSLGSISGDSSSGQAELGASPPTGRYDVGLGERYDAVGSLPGREQLHHLAHT